MGKYDGIKPPFPIEKPQINIKPGPPACPKFIPKCNPKPAIGYPKQKPPYIVEIDPTFKKSGFAADALLTGTLIGDLNDEFDSISEYLQKVLEQIGDVDIVALQAQVNNLETNLETNYLTAQQINNLILEKINNIEIINDNNLW